LLEAAALPPPDEVEYRYLCVCFLFHESENCVVIDLDRGADDNPPCSSGAGD